MTRVGENPLRLPKRFYETVTVESGALLLDGKPAKTKSRRSFTSPSPALMDAVAAEWADQREFIEFTRMPITRFAMTVVDLGDGDARKWRDILLSFLKSDLICYRANAPDALVEMQNSAWDPLLDWVATKYGIGLLSVEGVSFIEQPPAAIAAAERLLAEVSPASLLGMKTAAEISGSAVIALALAEAAFSPDALFRAARVDEAFQAERWGVDAEAQARAERLEADFLDACRFIALVG